MTNKRASLAGRDILFGGPAAEAALSEMPVTYRPPPDPPTITPYEPKAAPELRPTQVRLDERSRTYLARLDAEYIRRGGRGHISQSAVIRYALASIDARTPLEIVVTDIINGGNR